MTDTDTRGERVVDDSFLLYFNAHDATDRLPVAEGRVRRRPGRSILDTAQPDPVNPTVVEADASITVAPRSLVTLQRLD